MADIAPYNEQDLHNHFKQLLLPGFYLTEDGFLEKEEINRRVRVSYGYQEHYPLNVRFTGGGGAVRINEVEDIMTHVALETNYQNYDTDGSEFTFRIIINDQTLSLAEQNTLYDIDVHDDATFAQALPYLERLRDSVFLFAAQHPTVQSWYDMLKVLPEQEQAHFYASNFRELVIKKLVGESYAPLANQFIAAYQEDGEIDEVNFIQTLKDYLDTL